MNCTKCGKEIADNSKFCEYCGAKIGERKSAKISWIFIITWFAVGISNIFFFHSTFGKLLGVGLIVYTIVLLILKIRNQ